MCFFMAFLKKIDNPATFLSNYPSDLSEKVFKTVDEGIMITDISNRIVHVNPAFKLVTGYNRSEVVGQTPRILHSGVHSACFYKEMWEVLRVEGVWKGEIWNRRKNGEIYPEWLTIMEIKDDAGKITNYCGIFVDLSDREGALKHLKDVALTDPLTKLGNRQSLIERMDLLLDFSKQNDSQHAVLFLDLDRFKQINDTLGHAVGDELLKEFSRRLSRVVKNKDILARIGGDEFVITLTGLKHAKEAAIIADKILETLEIPHQVGSYELYISSSIGISLYPHDGKSLEELLKKADQAMYESKRNGRNSYTFYYDELEEDIMRMITLEFDLLKAIEQKDFQIKYQPKINMKSSKVDGVEVLINWNSKELGSIDSSEFIPLAENLGLIIQITNIVLEKTCIDILFLKNKGIESGRYAINIPTIYFMQPNFIDSIMTILETHNISPYSFEFELTEKTLMVNEEQTIMKLVELKELGFSLSIDHFGSGHSSLSYLPKFPLDNLKIDKRFIHGIFETDENRTIVDTIIYLAHRLGISVVAEGVENKRQMKFLEKMGCDFVQGVYLSKELSFEELGRYIETFDVMGQEL